MRMKNILGIVIKFSLRTCWPFQLLENGWFGVCYCCSPSGIVIIEDESVGEVVGLSALKAFIEK